MGMCRVASRTSVRPATKRDVRRVLVIDRISFSRQWDYDTFVGVLKDVFLVFEEKKIFRKILGFVVARFSEDGQGVMIRKIAVHPRHRGKGIGTQLIDAVVAQPAGRHVRAVDLHVHPSNTGAVRLYERLGFTIVRIEQPEYAEGQDYYLMRLKLGTPAN